MVDMSHVTNAMLGGGAAVASAPVTYGADDEGIWAELGRWTEQQVSHDGACPCLTHCDHPHAPSLVFHFGGRSL